MVPDVSIEQLINRAHREKADDGERYHLGCSMAGDKCDRWIWLSFRWAVDEGQATLEYSNSLRAKESKFRDWGQMLRLFRRGHHEEEWIVADLELAGFTVTDSQERVTLAPHVSGSIDGKVSDGRTVRLLECKSCGSSTFGRLQKDGVAVSKPVHYAQVQLYMLALGLDECLYVSVCKDDDRMHCEVVKFNCEHAEYIRDRAARIALSERIPDRIQHDPTWLECEFCSGHEFCFRTGLTKEVNCRTCAHSTPTSEGNWTCARYGVIPNEYQRKGCEGHVLHPDLTPWEIRPSESPWIGVYEIDGVLVQNGESDAWVFGSKELIDDTEKVVEIMRGVG